MDLVTYGGDAVLKTAFLGEIARHEAADALVKGSYGRMNGHFKGCAIGCSLYSLSVLQGKTPAQAAKRTSDHTRIPKELGWPLWLAYAEDNIFENLPTDLSKTWPRRLAEAVPVGVTVPDVVLAKLLRWMLVDAQFGVVKCADIELTKDAVLAMAALFDRTIGGEVVPDEEWAARAGEAAGAARAAWAGEAAEAAWAAGAARAARAGEAAEAAWAARAARAAGAAWAARAARAGEAAEAAWAAWAAVYSALSDELLRLLRDLDPSHVDTTIDASA